MLDELKENTYSRLKEIRPLEFLVLFAKLWPCLSTGSFGEWQHHNQGAPFQKLSWSERGSEEASELCPLGLGSVSCGGSYTRLCIPCGHTPLWSALRTLGQTRFMSGMQESSWHLQEDCSQPRLGKHPAPVGQEALDSMLEEIKGYCSMLSQIREYRHNKDLMKTFSLTHCFFNKHLLGPHCMWNPCVRYWVFQNKQGTAPAPEVRVWVGESCKLTYQRWQFSCAKCCDGEKYLTCLCAQQSGDRWPRAGVIWEQARVPFGGRNIRDQKDKWKVK